MPTKTLQLRGSNNVYRRADEVEAPPGIPDKPVWLTDEGEQVWTKLVGHLDFMGLLSLVDDQALSRYCKLWQYWRKACNFIDEHGDTFEKFDDHGNVIGVEEYPQMKRLINLADKLLRIEQQFGMTPSARASLAVDAATARQRAKDAGNGLVNLG